MWVQGFQMKADSEAMLSRMSHVERVVEDAGGAMDDIAVSLSVPLVVSWSTFFHFLFVSLSHNTGTSKR